MADAVNLNQFRKRKRREAEQLAAERNRVVHGLGKADKQLARRERERAERALASHERDPAGTVESGESVESVESDPTSTLADE